ncbi:cytochrome c-type biogenesis protein [Caviibacterium pharyngocola]|uniref:Cytochrome c-type biogenesis protein n=1 Tax=Caviibacterium pharyngocola TaxID=28159 RepID=A0A2M8RVH6_9PAST|nr:cytochrome c-type biogenesis protein [Caviibacterium pharyngocola]PJG82883.1 cytochrome C biogenesis protein [Caviibacterium pharyngocola]
MKKITALFFFFIHFSAFAAIDALNFASPQQENDYHALTQELRCPQCQNNNIADSNATIAVDMRAKVFELLQEGKQKQEIVDYMIARYGHFVTYNPPLTAATLALWVVPALLVLFGVVMIFRRKPHQAQTSQSAVNFEQESLSEAQRQRLNALLKEKE